MSLMDRLKEAGGKLGILHIVQPAAPEEEQGTRVITRKVTLEELTAEVKGMERPPAELGVAFEKVFEAAGVKAPGHGWTIERLRDALRQDAYQGLGRADAQKKLLEELGAAKAQVEDVVRDAVARDQALDRYEAFARRKYDERIAARRGRIEQLGEEIKRLQKEAASLGKEVQADEDRWRAWLKDKRAYERDMAWAVGYLLDRPVVTTSPDEEEAPRA